MISEYDLLSYRLFSSNWFEIITASKCTDLKKCHKILVIFTEVLEQEQKILVGKVFPLSLRTFSSVSTSNFTYELTFMTHNSFNGYIFLSFLSDFECSLSPFYYIEINDHSRDQFYSLFGIDQATITTSMI